MHYEWQVCNSVKNCYMGSGAQGPHTFQRNTNPFRVYLFTWCISRQLRKKGLVQQPSSSPHITIFLRIFGLPFPLLCSNVMHSPSCASILFS